MKCPRQACQGKHCCTRSLAMPVRKQLGISRMEWLSANSSSSWSSRSLSERGRTPGVRTGQSKGVQSGASRPSLRGPVPSQGSMSIARDGERAVPRPRARAMRGVVGFGRGWVLQCAVRALGNQLEQKRLPDQLNNHIEEADSCQSKSRNITRIAAHRCPKSITE